MLLGARLLTFSLQNYAPVFRVLQVNISNKKLVSCDKNVSYKTGLKISVNFAMSVQCINIVLFIWNVQSAI